MNLKSSFLQELQFRGFIKSCTNIENLDDWFSSDSRHFYIGFDCTADSLHVGSLMQIMLLRIGLKHQHQPILLFGGGTTKIGDPSGKDKTRQMMTVDDIEHNIQCIKKVLEQFLDLNKITIVNNDDWLNNINYIDFLREFGSKFSINRMLSFDSVKSRITREQELTFLEFNYSIMQAYDFYQLQKRFNCRVQFGGSDQWGNIISGVELIKKINRTEVFGLTTDLLTNSDGKKMGKTADGAIWLSKDKLSVYDYWQFFRNIDDKDVFKFLLLLTELSESEINHFRQYDQTAQINQVKKTLATEVTKICHGQDAALQAQQIAENLFENKKIDQEMPKIIMQLDKIRLTDLLIENKIINSRTEVKKLITAGAIFIENHCISDLQHILNKKDLPLQIKIGKKKNFMIIADESNIEL